MSEALGPMAYVTRSQALLSTRNAAGISNKKTQQTHLFCLRCLPPAAPLSSEHSHSGEETRHIKKA